MCKKKQEHLVNCENMKPNMKIYKSSACKIATHYCVIFLKQFVLLRKKNWINLQRTYASRSIKVEYIFSTTYFDNMTFLPCLLLTNQMKMSYQEMTTHNIPCRDEGYALGIMIYTGSK